MRTKINANRNDARRKWHKRLARVTNCHDVVSAMYTDGVDAPYLTSLFGEGIAALLLGYMRSHIVGRGLYAYKPGTSPSTIAYVLVRAIPAYAKRTHVWTEFVRVLRGSVDNMEATIAMQRLEGHDPRWTLRPTLVVPEKWWE